MPESGLRNAMSWNAFGKTHKTIAWLLITRVGNPAAAYFVFKVNLKCCHVHSFKSMAESANVTGEGWGTEATLTDWIVCKLKTVTTWPLTEVYWLWVRKVRKFREFPGNLVVRTVLWQPGTEVQSIVGKLTSHKLHSVVTEKKKVPSMFFLYCVPTFCTFFQNIYDLEK